ncbi:hypothetical protein C8R44DRAFT_753993 [Mycena epipterygia]|nr:hypothetical protein C8R44DRAFT_753993 [Mycena epipterygia]
MPENPEYCIESMHAASNQAKNYGSCGLYGEISKTSRSMQILRSAWKESAQWIGADEDYTWKLLQLEYEQNARLSPMIDEQFDRRGETDIPRSRKYARLPGFHGLRGRPRSRVKFGGQQRCDLQLEALSSANRLSSRGRTGMHRWMGRKTQWMLRVRTSGMGHERTKEGRRREWGGGTEGRVGRKTRRWDGARKEARMEERRKHDIK